MVIPLAFAVELATNEPQGLSHVQGMDAYVNCKRPFLTHLFWLGRGRDLFSPAKLQVRRMEMSNEIGSRVRYGEAFWRAHHKAWQQRQPTALTTRNSQV